MFDTNLLDSLISPRSKQRFRFNSAQNLLQAPVGQECIAVVDDVPVFWCSRPLADRPEISVDVSVLIMALNEGGNIREVVEKVSGELRALGTEFEIIVIDGGSKDNTVESAQEGGARVVIQRERGYSQGLVEGLSQVRGRYVVTLDGDCSHDPSLIRHFLEAASPGTVVVGSRWMRGGGFYGPAYRGALSRILSFLFARCLSMPISDMSSGYRVYARETLHGQSYESKDFSILIEMLVSAAVEGYSIKEIPLVYRQRKYGSSNARLFTFGLSYLATLKKMWMLRHDANGADYDHRAYDSLNLVQRWWQRARFRNIRHLLGNYWKEGDVLDVGCGSSRIIQTLTHAVAFDASPRKLRFLGRTNPKRVCGNCLELPFADGSFDCIIHAQLIEHLPMDDSIFTELHRVLRPGGTLVISTVDFGCWIWLTIKTIYGIVMPHAYAEEYVSRYTLKSLSETLSRFGFRVEEVRHILWGEITLRAIRL